MQDFVRNVPSLMVSLAVHAAVLIVLMLIPVLINVAGPEVQLESIFTKELPREQMEKQLDIETEAAESLNVISGGTLSATVGAAAQSAATPVDVQQADVMQEAVVEAPRVEAMQLSDEVIAEEFGEGVVTGEVGSMVEGYGDAMGVITQELVRMMREEKVTVVWLFDESVSLKDDREEIAANYRRVYEELGIAAKQDKKLRASGDPLLTVVASYGSTLHVHTPRPTSNVNQIMQAINNYEFDVSGEEKMCSAIEAIFKMPNLGARTNRRKIALIVVSDESGDDGDRVDYAINAARAANAPVYVLGRECMFGYPYGRQRYVHTEDGISIPFWLQIRRGPETAYPEALQWDGIHARWDAQSSGFGSYEQVRIAKETGGIFFVLPGEEEDLVGEGANDKRKFEFLALKQYRPLLLSRRDYIAQRASSPFRDALWTVIARLNPSRNELLFDKYDGELNIKREHYPLPLIQFREEAQREVKKAVTAGQHVNTAIAMLEDVRALRAREAAPRWQACYDLTYAQLHIFRLRLYQFLLAMDAHVNNMPKAKVKDANEWNFRRNRNRNLQPDKVQYERLKAMFGLEETREEYIARVKSEEKKATDLLKEVMTAHPGTPWARRAEYEIKSGFGFVITDRLWDPSGRREEFQRKLPKL